MKITSKTYKLNNSNTKKKLYKNYIKNFHSKNKLQIILSLTGNENSQQQLQITNTTTTTNHNKLNLEDLTIKVEKNLKQNRSKKLFIFNLLFCK